MWVAMSPPRTEERQMPTDRKPPTRTRAQEGEATARLMDRLAAAHDKAGNTNAAASARRVAAKARATR